jgi:hypothetical protein
MRLSRLRVLFFSFLLAGLSDYGVLADVSDAEENLYAITSALSGISQHLDALPSDSVSPDACLVFVLHPPHHSFLISAIEPSLLNSKPDGYAINIRSICCRTSISLFDLECLFTYSHSC